MSIGFRKGEGKSNKGISETWQKSEVWNCVKCKGTKKIGKEVCLFCKKEPF
jgi:hypothetical protein